MVYSACPEYDSYKSPHIGGQLNLHGHMLVSLMTTVFVSNYRFFYICSEASFTPKVTVGCECRFLCLLMLTM